MCTEIFNRIPITVAFVCFADLNCVGSQGYNERVVRAHRNDHGDCQPLCRCHHLISASTGDERLGSDSHCGQLVGVDGVEEQRQLSVAQGMDLNQFYVSLNEFLYHPIYWKLNRLCNTSSGGKVNANCNISII